LPRRKRSEETREAFINAALELCREGGPQSVSARRLGKMLGLSQMAVYRHFQDMEDLLAHAWDRAFSELLETIDSVLSDQDPREDLRNGLRAYVDWGIRNPGLYRLMFFVYFEKLEVLQEQVTGLRGLVLLRDLIQKCLSPRGATIDPDEAHSMALQSWFTVHGLTTVAISGRFARVTEVPTEDMAGQIIDRLCDSFSALLSRNTGSPSPAIDPAEPSRLSQEGP
jgi:AcrR family transcriptional regulator